VSNQADGRVWADRSKGAARQHQRMPITNMCTYTRADNSRLPRILSDVGTKQTNKQCGYT